MHAIVHFQLRLISFPNILRHWIWSGESLKDSASLDKIRSRPKNACNHRLTEDKLGQMNPKPNIALIHGWATHSEHWAGVAQDLESAGFLVRRHDLPGYRNRSSECGVLDFQDLVDDALDRVGDCDLWVGWSLGAMIALAAAAKASTSIRGVMLVSGTAKFCCDSDKEDSLNRLRLSVKENPRKAVRRFGLSMLPPAVRRELSQRLPDPGTGSIEDPAGSRATLLAGLEVLAEADLSEEVNKISVPVHLVSGEYDEIIPVSSGKELHALIPGSQFTQLPCGHIPFVECRKRFMETLFEFAQTIAASPASRKPV